MKKIFIFSDSHNNIGALNKLMPIMNESDMIISLGDVENDYTSLCILYEDKLVGVRGNCDIHSSLPEEKMIEVEGCKILLTHGHRYKVKRSTDELLIRAKELSVSAVLYGHTHQAEITTQENITLINPGHLRLSSDMSYCYCVISKGKIMARIVPLS